MPDLYIDNLESCTFLQVRDEGSSVLGLDVFDFLVEDDLGRESFASVP